MPTFNFEALNESGATKKGTVQASNSEDAIARIRSQGLYPTSVREQKVKKKTPAATTGGGGAAATSGRRGGEAKKFGEITINIGGVPRKQLTTFTRQFSTLQDAGLPILRSLQILEQQQKPGLLKQILDEVQEDVSAGSSLADAMAKHPKGFDKLYTKMVAAGEVAGVLDEILRRLADFLEKAAALRRKIISAMIYPTVVISVATLIVMGIMIVIVPQFQEIFDSFDTELPMVTQYLIQASLWMGGPILGWFGAPHNEDQLIPGAVYILFAPFIIYGLLKLIRQSEGGRYGVDQVVLALPVAGALVSKTVIAKFSRTLGTLIRAGVPILDAITITRETTGNAVYENALQKVHDSVRQGESFAEPLRQTKVCDAIVTNMIDVGEETGDLDKMLIKIADNYDEEVDTMVAGLVSLLEPVMVVVLGVLVGSIVIALFLPMVALIEEAGAM